MQKLTLIIMLIGFLSNSACVDSKVKVENGDILFRGSTQSDLSGAIDKVTQTGKATHFTHMGIAELKNGKVYVLHAAPEKGVCREALEAFVTDGKGQKLHTAVYRLKPGFQNAIRSALQRADSLIGQPYNASYIMGNPGFYCSEFIQQIFEADSVFQLEPMTFIDPETGEFFPTWVKYYKELNVEIPEGKPGCNPNGLAASNVISFIGDL